MSVFRQVSHEISTSLTPLFSKNQDAQRFFNYLLIPERVIKFKVSWNDRQGNLQWNKGYRVQFNSALGPYKGGIRFSKHVNEDILKALAFEQTFKNSLTGLNMGGGKGGSDFDPKDKTECEIRNFCQSYTRELYKYIGSNIDVPAGDIGVGSREIGYMYGEYRKLKNNFTGSMTGKGVLFGGSLLRPEATGFGVTYFLENMLQYKNDKLEGKKIIITGAGNVSTYALEKVLSKGGIIQAINDVSGTVHFKTGFNDKHLQVVKELYNDRKSLSNFIEKYSSMFTSGIEDIIFYNVENISKPWYIPDIKVDIVIPCATQNEIDHNDAFKLIESGCKYIAEGSNMSSTNEAIELFIKHNVFFGPSKACNSGGVSVSGLEMTQNASKNYWTRDEVDSKLQNIMKNVFEVCLYNGSQYSQGKSDILLMGSNIAAFNKIYQAMREQGMYY